ncbi:MAG: redoxin domain-containing protein [Alphaproteobacteria bacterium]|nr:redoxin domain-containing protein [Alphaproteobacteria bacterium]
MKPVLTLFFVLCFMAVSAQCCFDGVIRGSAGQTVFLGSLYGEKVTMVDSVRSDSTGYVRFRLEGRLPGMYRVKWSKDGYVDLIWNKEKEDVRFITDVRHPADSLLLLTSIENQIYRDYTRLDALNQERLQLLVPVIDYYPLKDSFYFSVTREMERIQKEQQQYVDSLTARYPASYAVRIAKIYQSPFLPSSMLRDDRLNYLKQHYFDKVDFTDTALMRSPVFANKAISYLALYSNNRLPQKQLEAEFIKAVTIMLGAASVSPDTYKFLLDYVVGGFDKYHFDEVITYIADNFQDPFSCEDQQRKTALQKKLETFKKIAVGKTAPELELADSKGKMFRLSALSSEYTLLIFWATQCPHCVSMMPRLKEIYDGQSPKRFEVMAVAVDTSRAEWTRTVKEQKMNWINVSDLKGFSGRAADDYNIYATPTMFLLDREKKILSKPISLREMEQSLRDYKLLR